MVKLQEARRTLVEGELSLRVVCVVCVKRGEAIDSEAELAKQGLGRILKGLSLDKVNQTYTNYTLNFGRDKEYVR